jgi:hypothetical protein
MVSFSLVIRQICGRIETVNFRRVGTPHSLAYNSRDPTPCICHPSVGLRISDEIVSPFLPQPAEKGAFDPRRNKFTLRGGHINKNVDSTAADVKTVVTLIQLIIW